MIYLGVDDKIETILCPNIMNKALQDFLEGNIQWNLLILTKLFTILCFLNVTDFGGHFGVVKNLFQKHLN